MEARLHTKNCTISDDSTEKQLRTPYREDPFETKASGQCKGQNAGHVGPNDCARELLPGFIRESARFNIGPAQSERRFTVQVGQMQ